MSGGHRLTRAGVAAVTALAALAGVVLTPTAAGADTDDEQALAEKYAPLVRLVPQEVDCGPGEPYRPVAVDPLFSNPEVALRGPWAVDNLVAVGPSEKDLSAPLYGYAMDFPGNPLRPGCDYEEWFNRIWGGTPTTVYAHVATEEAVPGRLALQYWMYYPFNDFNNKHESDWETIQLEFDVGSAAEALTTAPVTVLYSQHEAGEQATWGDPKLSVSDGTHPEVFASAGSHANHYETGLFLLRSTSQGLGCDSTLDAAPGELPVVLTIPSDPAEAARQLPWTAYQGQWGEQFSQAFYSGPEGPTAKDRWTEPFTATERRNETSYQVPGGDVYGVKTTDVFCSVVEQGSIVFRLFTNNPLAVLVGLVLVLGLILWLVRRTAWGSTRAFPLDGLRTFGQILSDAWEAYRSRLLLYVGIGTLGASVALGLALLQQGLSGSALTSTTPPPTTGWSTVLGTVGPLLQGAVALLSATACAQTMVDRAAARHVTVRSAFREAARHYHVVLLTAGLVVALGLVMALTLVLAPLTLVLVVATALIVPIVVFERRSGAGALRRSAHLVRAQKAKTAALVAFGALIGSIAGGFVGVLMLALFQVPFVLVNAIPGVVAALIAPWFAIALVYAYQDALLRETPVEENTESDTAGTRG